MAYVHLRFSGIEPHTISLSIVLERAIGLVAALVVGMVGIVALLSRSDTGSPLHTAFIWIFAASLAGYTASFLVFFHDPTQREIYRLAGWDRLSNRLGNRPVAQKVVEAIGS